MRFTPTRISIVVTTLAVAMVPLAASGQSLADVARTEEARRKQGAKTTKVYTNDNLRRDATSPAPAPPAGTVSAPGVPAAAPPPPPPADASEKPVRDQAYWKERITTARIQLERSKTFAEALQTRVNSLTADFVARDDPAQRSVIEQNRLKAIAELERVQREITDQTKAITAIEEEARKAGVPPGWLR